MLKTIYLIKSLDNGYYKIGISKNPIKRLKQLQTGNSSLLEIVKEYKSEYANYIEKVLHRQFNSYRKEGEWFELSLDIQLTFINECKKIENNIKILKESDNIFI